VRSHQSFCDLAQTAAEVSKRVGRHGVRLRVPAVRRGRCPLAYQRKRADHQICLLEPDEITAVREPAPAGRLRSPIQRTSEYTPLLPAVLGPQLLTRQPISGLGVDRTSEHVVRGTAKCGNGGPGVRLAPQTPARRPSFASVRSLSTLLAGLRATSEGVGDDDRVVRIAWQVCHGRLVG
jgi:hypothetical protein